MSAPGAIFDAKDRDLARFDLTRNLVVEAGAGTGKTTLLIQRLSALLLGPENPPAIEEVVALTFTDKAAGEIKERLAKTLSAGAGSEFAAEISRRFGRAPEDVRKLAGKALADLDKAPIGTIHSFASRLLRLYPVEAGVDLDFKVDAQGKFFDELFESEWAKWLDVELGENPPRGREWLEVLTRAGLESVEELARGLCAEGHDLSAAADLAPGVAEKILKSAENLARAAAGQKTPGGNSKILESIAQSSGRLKDLSAAAGRPSPPWPKIKERGALEKRAWPKSWGPEGQEPYLAALRLAGASSAWDEALVRRAAALTLPFAQAFRRTYARLGFVSFDGLLRRARDLVRDYPAAREEIKSRFRAFLIDEFQDTDPLQGEMLMFLAEEKSGRAKDWREVRLSPGKIFVVGDPKQSIYRFRGADITAYQDFSQFILSGQSTAPAVIGAACALSANFRSPQDILSPVNAVFDRIMREEPGLQPRYRELRSAVQAPSAGAQTAVEFALTGLGTNAKPLKAEASRESQFTWMARWIADNCGLGRAFAFKDAAILLRSASALPALLDALRRAGVPYAVEAEKNFYGAPEITDFLNLLRVLDDPDDALALTGLLRSPLCALEDGEIYRLARRGALGLRHDPPLGVLPEDARSRVIEFFALLRELRQGVGRTPLGELTRRILNETPILEASALTYGGEQSAANILKFARLADEFSDAAGSSLKEFIDFVRGELSESSREGESPLADESLEAARVMTIHKAKGLEFPVVFLADLSAAPRPGRKDAAVLRDWSSGSVGMRLPGEACGAAMAWLESVESARQEKEAVRLLYVAMTRAKKKLFLTGGIKPVTGSFAWLLAQAGAWPALDADGAAQDISLGGVTLKTRLISEQAGQADAAAPAEGPRSLPAPEILAIAWKKRLSVRVKTLSEPWILTPTGAAAEAEKRAWRAEEDDEPAAGESSALIGQVCHRVLEKWDFSMRADFSPLDLRKLTDAAVAELARADIRSDWPAVSRECAGILQMFLRSDAARRLTQAEILGREIPFVYEESGAVMRGTIDLLLRENGRLVVADYKSGKISAKDLGARLKKYAAQGEAYVKAVEKTMGERPEFRLIFLRAPELSST